MRKVLFAAVAVFAAAPALAKDVTVQISSSQQQFDSVAKDLVATLDYKAVEPSAATGLTGISLGVLGTYVPVSHKDDWKAVTGADFKAIGLAGVQVTKGLPLDLDVGAFYADAPGTNVKVYGGEIRYAILPGSMALPAVAVRATYSKLAGVDHISADSKAIDLSVSKGIGPITPYGGVGYVYGDVNPEVAGGPSESKVHKAKAYVGARFSLLLFGVTPEIDTVGGTMTYSLKFGFAF